jgi:hypothetical protein
VNTDIGTGDSEVPDLTITPADNTTTATLTVTKPDGTSTGVPVSGGALTPITGSAQHSQQWAADQPLIHGTPGQGLVASEYLAFHKSKELTHSRMGEQRECNYD